MSHDHNADETRTGRSGLNKTLRGASAAFALALVGTLGLSQAAQARGDVRWSISIGVPGVPVYVEPAPVYMAPPPPVYYAPPPRPVYVQPAPVIYGPPAYGYYDDRRGHGHRHHHHHRHYGGYRDSDRDGVPDRYDRRPENPWKR